MSSLAFAANSGVTYQGRILKPDGSPLSGKITQFKLQIRTPDTAGCLMYEEVQSQDLSGTNGAFSLTINDGTGSRTDTTGLTLDRIFANRGSFGLDATTCATGTGTYLPNAGDGRNLVVQFKDETMTTWEPIPAQKINYVPFAFAANSLQGWTPDSILRVVNGSGDPLTGLAPLSNAQYTALLALANGTSTAYTPAGQLNGSAMPTMASGEVLGWNGSSWVSTSPVPAAGSITSTMIQAAAIGTSQMASNVTISTSGTVSAAVTTTRDFKIYAASPSTFAIDMQAPALTASYALVWPASAGSSGQVLTTNGSGVLSWAAPSVPTQWTTHGSNISYDGGGYVGIGTTQPYGPLDIEMTDASTQQFIINRDSTAARYPNLTIMNYDGAGMGGASLISLRNIRGNTTSTTALQAGDAIGQIEFKGGRNGAFNQNARMRGFVTENQSTSAAGGAIAFDTVANGSVVLNERMRINHNGYVGIGTTSPSQSLDVVGSAKVSGTVTANAVGTSGAGTAASNAVFVGLPTTGLFANGSNVLGISTNGVERMHIDYNGAVGVGVANPTARLHLAAGTATAATAPLKFSTGTLLGTPEDGAMEYSTGLYFTIGTNRYVIPTNTAAGNFSGVTNISNTGGSINVTPSVGNSLIVNQTTTSTSSTTGALVVNGGAGIAGAVNAAGNITSGGAVTATTNVTTPQVYGSSAASGTLRLDGTSNATAGNVYIASAGGKVGIGTTSPSSAVFTVSGDSYFSGPISAPYLFAGNVPNYQYQYSPGGTAGYWVRILSVAFSAQFMVWEGKFAIASGNTGSRGINAEIYARIKQNTAMGTAPTVNVEVDSSNTMLRTTDVVAVTTANTSSQTKVELYVRVNTDYDSVAYMPYAAGSWSDSADYTPSSFLASLPSGTQTASNVGTTKWDLAAGSLGIAYTGANVGIGTTSPTNPLSVQSSFTGSGSTNATTMSTTLLVDPSASSSGTHKAFAISNSTGTSKTLTGTIIGQSISMTAYDATTVANSVGLDISTAAYNFSLGPSTITNGYGVRVNGTTTTNGSNISKYAGIAVGSGNVLALLGTTTIPASGYFSIYSSSANPSYFAGSVGIGTSSPSATLSVNGYAQLKSYSAQPVACSSATAGSIALTSAYVGCVCNSTTWVKLADGTTACSW